MQTEPSKQTTNTAKRHIPRTYRTSLGKKFAKT